MLRRPQSQESYVDALEARQPDESPRLLVLCASTVRNHFRPI